MHRWYAIESKPNCERKARFNIQNQRIDGLTVWLPETLKLFRPRRTAPKLVRVPYFARYLFASFDADETKWVPLKSSIGVLRMVASKDGRPTAVPQGYVEALQRKAAENNGLIDPPRSINGECQFIEGDAVKITDGTMVDFRGEFERVEVDNEEGRRLAVWLNMFGQPTRFVLQESHVAALSA